MVKKLFAQKVEDSDQMMNNGDEPPPLPARNGTASASEAPSAPPLPPAETSVISVASAVEQEISPVTILPHDVIEKLAELDLELSEGQLQKHIGWLPKNLHDKQFSMIHHLKESWADGAHRCTHSHFILSVKSFQWFSTFF